MQFLVVLGLSLLSIFCAQVRADFAAERTSRINHIFRHMEAVKELVTPGLLTYGVDCRTQLGQGRFTATPRFPEAVFDFRVANLLTEGAAPNDSRLAIAFGHLGNLEPLIRNDSDGYTFCLPGTPAIENLDENGFYDGAVEPRTLAYAARAYLSFHEITQSEQARAKVLALWGTLGARFAAPKGGFVTEWNPKTKAKSEEISHASVVYPWAASGFRYVRLLTRAGDGARQQEWNRLLEGSTRAALAMLKKDQLPVEFLQAGDLSPVGHGTYAQPSQVTIIGHAFQLLNFLMRAHQHGVVVPGQSILSEVESQFAFLLQEPFINQALGGVRNGFFQSTGQNVWGNNMAVWQLCEYMAALDRALRLGVFNSRPQLIKLAQSSFLKTADLLDRFFDRGIPVAVQITDQGDRVKDESEFVVPILGYHLRDLLAQLSE